MTDEQFKDLMYERCPDLHKIKENPNNFPVIKKYNNKIMRKNEHNLFDLIEKEIESRLKEQFNEELKLQYDKMAKIGDNNFNLKNGRKEND